VRWRKGADRPVIPQAARARILRALRAVDDVILGNSTGPRDDMVDFVRQIRPDIWCLHREPSGEEKAAAEELCIDIVEMPYIESPLGLNTSSIIRSIRESSTLTKEER
jgi:glycerol-3-phosphate cytidylyltransferase-like family protein